MLTKRDAEMGNIFHWEGEGGCRRIVGPRGGTTIKMTQVRRNGRTQTWKTRPDEWRLPVHFGIRSRDQFSIFHYDAAVWHVDKDCPLNTQDSI